MLYELQRRERTKIYNKNKEIKGENKVGNLHTEYVFFLYLLRA